MENIYTKHTKNTKLVKAQPQTIKFLLNYSKSLNVIEASGITIETNLN